MQGMLRDAAVPWAWGSGVATGSINKQIWRLEIACLGLAAGLEGRLPSCLGAASPRSTTLRRNRHTHRARRDVWAADSTSSAPQQQLFFWNRPRPPPAAIHRHLCTPCEPVTAPLARPRRTCSVESPQAAMVKQSPNIFRYGMPVYGVAWPEGDLIFVCGGGGSASTGVKNR